MLWIVLFVCFICRLLVDCCLVVCICEVVMLHAFELGSFGVVLFGILLICCDLCYLGV